MASKNFISPVKFVREEGWPQVPSCTDFHWPYASPRQPARKWKYGSVHTQRRSGDVDHRQGGAQLPYADWRPNALADDISPWLPPMSSMSGCPLHKTSRSRFGLRVIGLDDPPREGGGMTRHVREPPTTGEHQMRLVISVPALPACTPPFPPPAANRGVSPEELEIALVAPEPTLVVRPRLYEASRKP